MIEANRARALRQAVFEVVPGAERLQRLTERGGVLVPATGEAGTEPSIYAGYHADGAFLGYAIPGEAPGLSGRHQAALRLRSRAPARRRHADPGKPRDSRAG